MRSMRTCRAPARAMPPCRVAWGRLRLRHVSGGAHRAGARDEDKKEVGVGPLRPGRSMAYRVGARLGEGILTLKSRADEAGVTDEAVRLKKQGYKAAGVDESTGDMALKAGAGTVVAAKAILRLKRVVVGGAAVAAMYAVGRAGAPQAADRALELGKRGVAAGAEVGESFWAGVLTGLRTEPTIPPPGELAAMSGGRLAALAKGLGLGDDIAQLDPFAGEQSNREKVIELIESRRSEGGGA